ncbi:MAG: alpha/beta hydrolase [Smithellaceae bacterium]|nr:alpha/beta hydrolase [Smithellaceae bacterium]
MHYKLSDRPDQPVLVLVPGMGAGSSSWFLLARKLTGVRILRYDPRGLYKSGHPDDYPFSAMSSDLLSLLNYLGIQKAHILGWSLGGAVAQDFAARNPERVDRLILMSTIPLSYTTADPELSSISGILKQNIGIPENPTDEDFRRSMRTITKLSFNKPFLQTLMTLGTKFIFLQDSNFYEGLAQQWRATAKAETYDKLNSIRASTLLLHGTDDRLVPIEARDLIYKGITTNNPSRPNVVAVDIIGGSHGCAIENVDKVATEINKFLAEK